MIVAKVVIYTFIFLSCSLIGILTSKKYINRAKELNEFKNAFSIFETKIKFTYEPIPEIFNEISHQTNSNVGHVFKVASNNMKQYNAGKAWEIALKAENLNINIEDKELLNGLGKLLGKTDINGQINQIELTTELLEKQIRKADEERTRNEKLYRTLGLITGIGIVIILI